MKLYRHVVRVPLKGTVAQILFIGLIFCFRKFRAKCFKNGVNVSLFSKEIKIRTYI